MLPMNKKVIALVPASVATSATAAGPLIDTKGYKYMSLDVFAATADVVSNTLAVLKLQEADTTDATNLVDVTAFKAGSGFTLATNAGTNSSTPNIWAMLVDLRNRKRYLQVSVTPKTTMVMSALATLSRGEVTPTNAAQMGVLQMVTD